jgi:hypothetical protein
MKTLCSVAIASALMALASGCATPHLTGSNTIRCSEGGRWTRATDPTTYHDTESFECAGAMVRTGTLSPQAAGVTLRVIQGALDAASGGAREIAP